MSRITRLTAIAALVALIPGAAAAAELASHRALYAMTLHSAKRGSGITAVQGKMAVDWSRTCAGWTFEHQSFIEVSFSESAPVRISSSASSWESLDGSQYRFSVRNLTNGKVTESVEGVARLDGPGGQGQVEFSSPEPTKMPLPAGTLFPVRHSDILIDAAAGAPTMLVRTVFDGMSFDGAFLLSAVLGRPAVRKAGDGEAVSALKGRRYWPVQLAFFPFRGKSSTPEHEVGLHLYANGVTDNLLISFGEFMVRSRLTRLQILDPPACG